MDLPNMEEYFSDLFEGYSNNQYSKPLFQCPVCKVGEVHRDDTIILASYPPKNFTTKELDSLMGKCDCEKRQRGPRIVYRIFP